MFLEIALFALVVICHCQKKYEQLKRCVYIHLLIFVNVKKKTAHANDSTVTEIYKHTLMNSLRIWTKMCTVRIYLSLCSHFLLHLTPGVSLNSVSSLQVQKLVLASLYFHHEKQLDSCKVSILGTEKTFPLTAAC